ncbi:hypothetical protein [Nocardioides marmorisolisilvae]|uniref:Peptidase n=1 Tax=Nocardioides marmorisolisilvae TaxID=1542737 RepID=A0A3N0DPY9_9ACTN|nr:hypothetical protein [Nocardioides marmorisolisilvae]RNL77717.1 hypothetical protein EFL95_17100 [Nocardioides marmorisolisilvae]
MRGNLRLALVVWVSIVVVAATIAINKSGGGGSADELKKSYAATAANTTKKTGDNTVYNADGTHAHDPGTPPHNDNDPATKNSVSRSAPTTDKDSADPTTPAQASRNMRAAAAQRAETPAPLKHVAVDPSQPSIPTNRYNLFNACYGLQSTATGKWLTTSGFKGASRDSAAPLYFKPSSLGHYLVMTKSSTFLGGKGLATFSTAQPGPSVNWTVTQVGARSFRLQLPGSGYLANSHGIAAFAASPGTTTQVTPVRRTGCTAFPEISTNVVGDPTAGVTSFQETRGYIDAHTHGMAFEFLGGDLHCGRPWSPWGVTVALKGCTGVDAVGSGAVGGFLSGKPGADPKGWPTFKDWPAPDALTQEGTYYKWMERNWRAGQRVLVNLLVENNQLCMIYPRKRNSCDDMTSIRLQAHDMHLMEQYIDAQHGGPGKGWYRIVTNPEQARTVINSGKMAVVMGIETSVLFGCHTHFGRPTCTAASIEKQLTAVRKMGVTQMELVNKFDNALAGVAGDEGTTGYLVNAANTLETGSPWHMTTCDPNDPEVHDKDQSNSAPIPSQDALFGAILKAAPGVKNILDLIPAIPLYPAKHHCNTLGLTPLGADTIKGMVKRHMLFDPDHMSVKARKQSLDLIDKLGYPGVVSSHSWSTPDAYPRIYQEKGFITPYAGDSNGFVEKWKRHLTWANPAIYWGIGFGADINGLGAQGNPRPDAAKNPVTYPFTGLGGVKIYKQTSGQKTYDINKDGVAHYGLYPDWIQDLKMQAGPDIVTDMTRGPEAYLQMWERAYGIQSDACSTPSYKRSASWFRSTLRNGDSWWSVLNKVGQPHRRLDQRFTYCTTSGSLAVNFDKAGHLTSIS